MQYVPLTDVPKTSTGDDELNFVDEIVLESLDKEPCYKICYCFKCYCM